MQQSRRAFIGSATAATAATVVAGVSLIDTPSGQAQNYLPAAPDAVIAELERQLRSANIGIRAGRGEAARQAATTLRFWAAYGVAQGYDTTLRQGVRQIIEQRGRSALVFIEPNHAEMERTAARLGLQPGELKHPDIDPALREQSIDYILKNGITPALSAAAAALDQVSVRLEARAAQLRPVAARQSGCDSICGTAGSLADVAGVACGAALFLPYMLPLCEAATAAYLEFQIICWICQVVGGW